MSGIRVIKMPRRYGIPLLGRYLYWRLFRRIIIDMQYQIHGDTVFVRVPVVE